MTSGASGFSFNRRFSGLKRKEKPLDPSVNANCKRTREDGSSAMVCTMSCSSRDSGRCGSLSSRACFRTRGLGSRNATATCCSFRKFWDCNPYRACKRVVGALAFCARSARSGRARWSCRSTSRRAAVSRCQTFRCDSNLTNSAVLCEVRDGSGFVDLFRGRMR